MKILRFIRDCFRISDGSNFWRDWLIGVAVLVGLGAIAAIGWLILLVIDLIFGPTVGTVFLILALISWVAGVYAWGRNAEG